MGTTGTGRLTDYGTSGGGGGQGGGQGGGPYDPCGRAVTAQLEEVARAPYAQRHGHAPPVQEKVELELANNRLAVVATTTREIIGYLPTRLNYLANCLSQGFAYTGEVVFSQMPQPTVFDVQVALQP